MASTAVGIER
jgi:hypothetical protein